MPTYFPKRIEPKWQKYWLENKTFRAPDFDERPKYYILDMFPYPSSDGLHVGHPEGYTATDIIARHKRMRGINVLHPMGWDAFGLPAEQHAVKTGTHPRINTSQNIDNFRRQIQMLGFSYDWDREVNTTDPGYVKWTQWIFLKLYHTWYDAEAQKGRPIEDLPIPAGVARAGNEAIADFRNEHRLAYVAEVPVNWCEALGTVLANEEVQNGRSEIGQHPVVRLPLRQWMLRITSYAERLLADLDGLDWPEPIKEMQRNWIGRSEGAEVDFPIVVEAPADHVDRWFAGRGESDFPAQPEDLVIRVYTTRPDTLFGATYMVLAPEHPLVDRITTAEQKSAVRAYRDEASRKSDFDRTELAKEKTGVFTGAYAVNPANGEPIPVWIADYVLMGYGTGAIMAVPAHDERDFEFAKKYDLPIVEVVVPPNDLASVVRKAHEWMGEWERRVDRTDAEDEETPYLKVAILFNCGFDIESFESDVAENKADPFWAEVGCHYDPEEGKAIAVRYLEDAFIDMLEEYIEAEEDTQILLFTLDPTGCGDIEEYEETDGESGEEDDEEFVSSHAHQSYHDDEHEHDHDGACLECGSVEAFAGEGVCVDSGLITGLATREAKTVITDWLAHKGLGRKTINYKLRDWLFSRQRYWGEPFPIVWDEAGRHQALPETELPVRLPKLTDFKPTGTPEPPLSKATDWMNISRDGKTLRRETNTMPQWAGSCWYFLRYLDPKNDQRIFDPAKEQYWMPVDLYVGGAEHAVLHLLYSRFWHKVLFDAGVVSTKEPFQKLVNQGMILGETEYVGYRSVGDWVTLSRVADNSAGEKIDMNSGRKVETVKLTEDQVAKDGTNWIIAGKPDIQVEARAFKMSKSRGNVINPDRVVDEYGADSLRLYEMFMGPLEATKPWSMKGVEGIWRFLNRVWRLIVDERAEETRLSGSVSTDAPTREQLQALHQTIGGVSDDIDSMRFNTAISKLMELVNFLNRFERRPKEALETLVLLLSPFAPHLCEELWEVLGRKESLAYHPWPAFDPALAASEEVEVAVQVNNKVCARVVVPTSLTDEQLLARAGEDVQVKKLLDQKTVVRSFVATSRKGKLVNFVVK